MMNKLETCNHLGIIMDGNRRYAQSKKLPKIMGHKYGAETTENIIEWVHELSIPELTLYTLSIQNLNRKKEEVTALMKLFGSEIEKLISDERLDRLGMKVNFSGDKSLLPNSIADLMYSLEEKSETNNQYTVNFAIAYGGREELIHAFKKIARRIDCQNLNPNDITESLIQDNLYIKNDLDVLIRTGGDYRTSNFLPWQAIYAELFFLEKLWPEVQKDDIVDVLSQYENRERRFGN